MSEVRHGFKVLTHSGASPIQGGTSILTGALPLTLPEVKLDRSEADCGAGWNYCADAGAALKIAGLWPTGRPSRVFEVEASADAIERGNKRRASRLTLLRECTESEVAEAISGWFPDAPEMAGEQMAWRAALARPMRDEQAVEAGLRAALAKRGVDWQLKRFPNAGDAGAAWDAWAARDARDALSVYYMARKGWVKHAADLLTVGIRDAYTHGLAIALPTGPAELGWAMEDA